MASNTVLQLQQPLTDGGIRAVNFFNGRLLTGKDLSREQQARREADWRLGLALGDGVAFGLEVEQDKAASQPSLPVARIQAGLAFNRAGQALRLANDVSVALARPFAQESAGCLFTACNPLVGGSYVAGAGLYLLTIAPAEQSEGRAANSGFDPANVRCNTDATVEAVQFRLLWIKPTLFADLDLGAATFRNEIAYRCFGAGVQSGWFADLFGAAPRQDDLLEALRPNPLSDLDVPLGLLFFVGKAELQFIDLWSVRRPPTRPPAADIFPSLTDGRRTAVGQAMFLQFQRQINELAPVGKLGKVTAQDNFRYLPPAGIIPVAEETGATDAQATQFFVGMSYHSPVFINAARLEGLLRESLGYPPIDTQTIDPKTGKQDPAKGEMVWLYRVRENRMAIDFSGSALRPRSYLVFASGHLPYRGEGRYDLSFYNYGNFDLDT